MAELLNFLSFLLLVCSVCERGVWNCTEDPCPALTPCPPGLEYSPQSCLRTCSSLDTHPEPCPEPIQGCVCPADTVLLVGVCPSRGQKGQSGVLEGHRYPSMHSVPPQGDSCVPSSECPCHHNGRLYYSNDTITRDCNTWWATPKQVSDRGLQS